MPSKSVRGAVRFCAVGVAVWMCSTDVIEAERKRWHLVRIPDPVAWKVSVAALDSAASRLVDEDCAKVLVEFENRDGRTLADHLSSLGVDIQTYVGMVTFMDDSRHPLCEKGGLFFTSPGSRVVRVCVERLKSLRSSPPQYLRALFIHEVLHTLGLGEAPPSSEEITKRVLARCGGK